MVNFGGSQSSSRSQFHTNQQHPLQQYSLEDRNVSGWQQSNQPKGMIWVSAGVASRAAAIRPLMAKRPAISLRLIRQSLLGRVIALAPVSQGRTLLLHQASS